MTAHQAAAPAPAATRPPPATSPNLRVVWLLVAATFVVFLNETTMGVALQSVMVDLDVDARTGQWLTTAFMLTMAVVIPVTGYLIQRFDTRSVFRAAMVLFSVGTLLAAVAPGFGALLVGRVVQASGTALMLPLLMTTLMTLVPPASRGAMMGNVSLVISVAPAVGPTLSGVLLGTLGWRGIFAVMLPLAVGMLFVGLRYVDNVGEGRPAPLDPLSVPLSAVGFGGLVYGLSRVGSEQAASGAGGLSPLFAIGIGLAAIAGFVLRQLRLQRRDAAMLDLRTLRHRPFALTVSMMCCNMAALFGVIVVLPLYLQTVLHLPPLTVGLLVLPGGLIMGLLGRPVGRLYDRFGPRVLVVPGSILLSAAMWSLAALDEGASLTAIVAAHVTMSVGLGLVFTPLFTAGLSSLPPRLYPHGSAVLGSMQQVSGAAGVALFVTIMSIGTSAAAGRGLTPDAAAASGIRFAFLAGALISLVSVSLSLLVRRTGPLPADAAPEPATMAH